MKYAVSQLLALLTAAIAVDGFANGAKIGLVTDDETINPQEALADVTQATYDSYALSAAVVWGTPHVARDGSVVVQCTPKEFKPGADGDQVIVTQVILVDSAGTGLIASYRLDEPLLFETTNDVHMVGFPLVLQQPDVALENIIP